MILPILLVSAFFNLAGADSSSSYPCNSNGCARGIDVLQIKKFGPDSWTIGNDLDDYSFVSGAANGTISGGNIFCSSNAVCLLQSNQLFEVPCKDELQVQGSLSFQAQSIGGQIISPYGIDQDPFYGYGSIGFVDPKEGFVFEYRITNGLIYAVYGRVTQTETDCKSFLYLVPVSSTDLPACSSYDIALEKCKGTVSYRLGGKEVLRIVVGEQIDEKFKVYGFSDSCGCGCSCEGAFPEAVRVRVGNGAMQAVDCCSSQSQPACQQAVFSECLDDIKNACRVNCTYAPSQPIDTFDVGLASLYKSISVMSTKEVTICEGGCSESTSSDSEESNLSCEQHFQCRRERRQRVIDNLQYRLD